ncbi:sulfite oxidase heme-binding subunit YedZ [Sulfurirhabdus autotrophica]|uniref:Protein-methionine-sulfoxide reductase heme-binding subunit MsrQ n=1 Tax=Sulfurirhabdus autotrophica TaxID=1706046 RepID=A0A4R3Y3V4_9PROT|nr:protein-methionine-sulfoxide reductase heme-binding subunit MsrQ [Sulfurirhabdus autotrophica]TCV86410.1 sulfoxide reductase heme-binding subunit YedZ [Sulfurirhabdus autotrophica]
MKFFPALKALVFLACLIPLARLGWFGYTSQLGANPIELITRSTGTWTLVFLMITLGVTPLRKLTGWSWLIKLRRMLGLYAFFYVCLHFTTYIWLDQFFDPQTIYKDIIKRPFITVGFAAFLLLIPLAVTSTNKMVKRLGGKRWQQLHRLVYIIATFGVIHYWWLVKKDITQPVIYAIVLSVLLGYRALVWLRKTKSANLSSSHSKPMLKPSQQNS